MRIVQAALRAFVLPLVSPLATAHGPIAVREGLLVRLEDEAGRFGSGEATPLPAFGGEDLAACRAALRAALNELAAVGTHSLDAALACVAVCTVDRPIARAALEGALCSLAAQREGMGLASWIRRRAGLPGEAANRVRVQALVSGATPHEVAASARAALARGCSTFKLKLAADGDFERDLERVAALRAVIGAGARIRLDANEGWTRAEAGRALSRLAPFDIEFVEQPVARDDLEGLAALDRAGAVPVAADEALIGAGLEACLARRAARIFVVKPAVLGGIVPSIALVARAREVGIRIVFSNLIEGRVGREAAEAIAAALAPADASGAEEVHGLGTAPLLARDLEPESASAAPEELVFDAGWLARFAGAQSGARAGGGDGARAGGAALVWEGRNFDHGSVIAAARAAGETLAALGLAAGDLVAVLAPPSPAGVVLIHALLDRRIVLLPINARLAEVEIAAALAAIRPTALVVAALLDSAHAARLAHAGGCPLFGFASAWEVESASVALPSATPAPPATAAFDARLAVVLERREALGVSGSVSAPAPAPLADPIPVSPSGAPARDRSALAERGAALVLLTSGTSGRPKAAVLTRANLIASARASAQLLGSEASDRWLLCMPLFHVGGLSILVRAALVGATVVLEPRFDAARVSKRLDEDGITHVSLVATMLEQLLDLRGAEPAPTSLRLVLLGGGPASDALLARAIAAGYPIAPTYGLTEAASQVATRPPPARGAPLAGCGVVGGLVGDGGELSGGLVTLPGVEVRIVDAADHPVAAGVEGEIHVRGPIVMAGYLDDPEATARALRGGWLATGDFGRLDGAGRLRVLDRRSDLIVSGGENVYPAELEGVLAAHPDVAEAGVVGVPDARFGARPLAYVVWRAGADRDPARLAGWCRERLAGYKQPVDFVAVESLPRNASGKLLRRELVGRVRARRP